MCIQLFKIVWKILLKTKHENVFKNVKTFDAYFWAPSPLWCTGLGSSRSWIGLWWFVRCSGRLRRRCNRTGSGTWPFLSCVRRRTRRFFGLRVSAPNFGSRVSAPNFVWRSAPKSGSGSGSVAGPWWWAPCFGLWQTPNYGSRSAPFATWCYRTPRSGNITLPPNSWGGRTRVKNTADRRTIHNVYCRRRTPVIFDGFFFFFLSS